MPKRYRIEMTLFNDETNTQLETDTHKDTYASDEEAKAKFADKKDAARKTGKGSG